MPPSADGRPTEPDETFTRRVCAVLLADVRGFTALMGEDDEGTARAVQRLQTLIQQIVAEAKGRADAFAGDGIFATFDSVVAAVDAALSIQRQIAAQRFAGRQLQVRMGVHFGDVLLREGAPLSTAVGSPDHAEPGCERALSGSRPVRRRTRARRARGLHDLWSRGLDRVVGSGRGGWGGSRDAADDLRGHVARAADYGGGVSRAGLWHWNKSKGEPEPFESASGER